MKKSSKETQLYTLLLRVEEILFLLKEVGIKDRDYERLQRSAAKVIDKLNKSDINEQE